MCWRRRLTWNCLKLIATRFANMVRSQPVLLLTRPIQECEEQVWQIITVEEVRAAGDDPAASEIRVGAQVALAR
jgi:hypothetical protein